jgi:hypothetical protein
MIGPSGLSKSNLTVLNIPDLWYINFTWTPRSTQVGENLLCFKAIDDALLATDLYCIKLYAYTDVQTSVSTINNSRWIIAAVSGSLSLIWAFILMMCIFALLLLAKHDRGADYSRRRRRRKIAPKPGEPQTEEPEKKSKKLNSKELPKKDPQQMFDK